MVVKQITVRMEDQELKSMAKTPFDNWKDSREVIDFHLTDLLERDKVSLEDYEKIREILIKK